MFFSAELLQKRDSGFGLLWLAATLGAQSSFRKLPKRSVMSADITQLCDLIVEPVEPLALRLSSNLMVGVVRVYKVKQEILMSDVSTCSNSLKKMIHDVISPIADHMQLQLGHQTVSASALSLAANPKKNFALELDNMVADWDEYLNFGEDGNKDDEDYDPNKKAKKKDRRKALQPIEQPRTDAHTLQEFNDDFFSQSLDLSLAGRGGGDVSSSQAGSGFNFGDPFQHSLDGIELSGALDDDFVRELGEDWQLPALNPPRPSVNNSTQEPVIGTAMNVDIPMPDENDLGFMLDSEIPSQGVPQTREGSLPAVLPDSLNVTPRKRTAQVFLGEEPDVVFDSLPAAQQASEFSRQFLSQDDLFDQDMDIPNNELPDTDERPAKKSKKARRILDRKTQLTDEELKAFRAEYLKEQRALRVRSRFRRLEKFHLQGIENMLWTVPLGIQAPALADFWRQALKVQADPEEQKDVNDVGAQRPSKRRRLESVLDDVALGPDDIQGDLDLMQFENQFDDQPPEIEDNRRFRSSEEPEQGRRISRPPSALGSHFDIGPNDLDIPLESQKSSLFPWDNAAGGSSSANEFGFDPVDPPSGSDGFRLRGLSLNSRDSPLPGSRIGTAMQTPTMGLSPLAKAVSHMSTEEFAFDIPNQAPEQHTLEDTQQSGVDVAALEKHSHNFLEYAKMQAQTLRVSSSGGSTALTFDAMVPKTTCTRHVAAAAFYHCLVLSTKNLLRVDQQEAHGVIALTVL